MAPLDLLLADVADQPSVLVRELQALGEAVLGGQRKEQSPFSSMRGHVALYSCALRRIREAPHLRLLSVLASHYRPRQSTLCAWD